MNKCKGVALLLLFAFVVIDVSNDSLHWKLRHVVAIDTSESQSNLTQVSPPTSPDSMQIDDNKMSNETVSEDQKVDSVEANNTVIVDNSNKNNDTNTTDNNIQGEKNSDSLVNPEYYKGVSDMVDYTLVQPQANFEMVKRHRPKTDPRVFDIGLQNCTGSERTCTDQNALVACIIDFHNDSNQWEILAENDGEATLTVDILTPHHIDGVLLEIPKNQTRKALLNVGQTSEVTLYAGYGKCVLHLGPYDDNNINNNTTNNNIQGENNSDSIVNPEYYNGINDTVDYSLVQPKADFEMVKRHRPKTDPRVFDIHLQNCTGVERRCTDQNALVACIIDFHNDSNQWEILAENDGEVTLTVDLFAPHHIDDLLLEIPKNQTRKVLLNVDQRSEVTLYAGYGKCVLHLGPYTSQGNYVLYMPSLENINNPVNFAYLLIFSVIVLAGMWACTKLWRKRQHGEVQYQELEMGLPESSLPRNVVAAEGWDQGWDQDWNEENGMRSPRQAGSITAGNLKPRPANREGWDREWDD